MTRTMAWILGGALMFGAVGCGEDDRTEPVDTKPVTDPDAQLTGKADHLTNWYTTLMGELPLNDVVFGEIDYPDYYHGYTIELEEGQVLQFTTWADAVGTVRLYGPALPDTRGRLRFASSAARERATRNGERYVSEFDFEVERPGTYMLLYGPDYVWHSKYEMSTKCIAGCDDGAEITVADIISDPARYSGRTITITGNVLAEPAICTKMACTEENPCCNSCGAGQSVYDGNDPLNEKGLALGQDGERLSCGGNECTYADNCTVESGRYEITGEVVLGRFENHFEIASMTRVTESCVDHDDCADGWCRQKDWDTDEKECVPFQPEGAHCGGFTPPHMAESCPPDLQCVFRPFIADAPGTCRRNVTVADITANPDAFDGLRVNIDGHVTTGPARCTRMACSEANPCCNSCGASQEISDVPASGQGISLAGADGSNFGCSGNECTYADNCDIEVDSNVQYRVVGVVRKGDFGQLTLEVEEHLALEWVN